jgi:DNA modification methylase
VNLTVQAATVTGEKWTAMLGDSCQRLTELKANSIDLSVYSPPFADLYTYSNSEFDLGNSRDYAEFFRHYAYIIREVLRVTKPGRSTCVHTADIPALATKDGYIGIKDFPGDVVRAYEAEGWVFFGRAVVAKNPQAQAIRTKSKGLLFVQLRKDSSDSRPAILDHILIFKKPGDNAIPITPVTNGEMDNETWIEWASGIWTGISESDTLQYTTARDANDEKHVCPLQLGTIERCIKLYSNPGETVLTPFMGIGSEAYEAIRLGRKAIGIELKQSYFDVAVKNLREIERVTHAPTLFDWQEKEAA